MGGAERSPGLKHVRALHHGCVLEHVYALHGRLRWCVLFASNASMRGKLGRELAPRFDQVCRSSTPELVLLRHLLLVKLS